MWIHVLALSSLASVIGEDLKWPAIAVFAAWVGAGVAGIFPIVRTVVMFSLLICAIPWWQAIGVTVIGSAVLLMVEGFGKSLIVKPDGSGSR